MSRFRRNRWLRYSVSLVVGTALFAVSGHLFTKEFILGECAVAALCIVGSVFSRSS